MVTTRKLYASVTATANDAAHLDMFRDGTLRGIEWTAVPTGALATGDYVNLELSFSSTNQTSTNDANGIISMCGAGGSLTAAGGPISPGRFSGPTAIPVKQGQRVYLNAVEAGANTWLVSAVLHIEEK